MLSLYAIEESMARARLGAPQKLFMAIGKMRLVFKASQRRTSYITEAPLTSPTSTSKQFFFHESFGSFGKLGDQTQEVVCSISQTSSVGLSSAAIECASCPE